MRMALPWALNGCCGMAPNMETVVWGEIKIECPCNEFASKSLGSSGSWYDWDQCFRYSIDRHGSSSRPLCRECAVWLPARHGGQLSRGRRRRSLNSFRDSFNCRCNGVRRMGYELVDSSPLTSKPSSRRLAHPPCLKWPYASLESSTGEMVSWVYEGVDCQLVHILGWVKATQLNSSSI